MRKTSELGMVVELSADEASKVVGGLGKVGDWWRSPWDAAMYVVEVCDGTDAAVFTTGAALDRQILVNQGRASKQPGRQ